MFQRKVEFLGEADEDGGGPGREFCALLSNFWLCKAEGSWKNWDEATELVRASICCVLNLHFGTAHMSIIRLRKLLVTGL